VQDVSRNQGLYLFQAASHGYWLYLAHLPLILGAQIIVRDWPLPALVKWLLLTLVVTGLLLLVYDKLVTLASR